MSGHVTRGSMQWFSIASCLQPNTKGHKGSAYTHYTDWTAEITKKQSVYSSPRTKAFQDNRWPIVTSWYLWENSCWIVVLLIPGEGSDTVSSGGILVISVRVLLSLHSLKNAVLVFTQQQEQSCVIRVLKNVSIMPELTLSSLVRSQPGVLIKARGCKHC